MLKVLLKGLFLVGILVLFALGYLTITFSALVFTGNTVYALTFGLAFFVVVMLFFAVPTLLKRRAKRVQP